MRKIASTKVADPKDPSVLIIGRKFSDAVLNQLKNTKTVFFYKKGNMDMEANDSIRQAITSAWDLTPIIFDDVDHLDQYAGNPNFSYFIIEGIETTVSSQSSSYTTTHFYLVLKLFKEPSRTNKEGSLGLCRIELYPNSKTLFANYSENKYRNAINKIYQTGSFYNWSPVLLKAELEIVSSNLKKHYRPWLFQNIKSDGLGQLLSTDTLYVPKRLLVSFNKFNGKEKNMEDNMFRSYHYKYRICTEPELFQLFVTEHRGRFLFQYVKSSTDKYVSIFDLKDQELIYKKYSPVSYNLKNKDITNLGR